MDGSDLGLVRPNPPPANGLPPRGRQRVPTALLVGVLIVTITGWGWLFVTESRANRREVEASLRAVAELKVNRLIAWRDERAGDAERLSKSPILAGAIARFLEAPTDDVRQALLADFAVVASSYGWSDVQLVDADGHSRLSLSGRPDDSLATEAVVREVLRTGHPGVIDLHVDDYRQVPHMAWVAPIRGPTQPAPVGAVALEVDGGSFLYPYLQTWPTPRDTAETLLVRRSGGDVEFLNDLRHRQHTALALRLPLDQPGLPAALAIGGRQGVVEGPDYRGVPVLAAVLPVPDSPWFLVAKIDRAEAMADWRTRALLMVAALLGLVGFITGAGLALRQRERRRTWETIYAAEAARRAAMERHSTTLKAIGDGVITVDVEGRVELLNPVAEQITGWSQAEAAGRPLADVFRIVDEDRREPVENPVDQVIRDGLVVGLANHTLLYARDGTERPIADSAAPIRDAEGALVGIVLVFRDQSEERRAQRLLRARLDLLDFGPGHGLDELLTRAIDQIGALVASPIGFYHFVEPDQRTISAQQWSTRTTHEFCRTEGRGMQYDLDQAGIWAECVRLRQPVIHNDYLSVAARRGLPEGHTETSRELIVPVLRQGQVVAIVGVGNKPVPYTEHDVHTVARLADATWEMVARARAEEALAQSEARYRSLVDEAAAGIYRSTVDGRLLMVNPVLARMFGYESAEELMASVQDVAREFYVDPAHREEFMRLAESGGVQNAEFQLVRRDGQRFWVSENARAIRDTSGRVVCYEGVMTDITERRSLERQLREAQKMESVGLLAGGVAHDYNNMLSVILGHVELALEQTPQTSPLVEDLEEIRRAATRSVDITRQLLAFARRQPIVPRNLDFNATIESLLKMLRRLIGEDITLAWQPGGDLWPVCVDPAQVDQILANLCVNARDAIPNVGAITIATDTVTFDEEDCAGRPGFTPGSYVRLSVTDTGTGMDQATMARIFEPFFTTKEAGRGTGLGLATVYGIVKQNNGFINVYSEPDKGTTFTIYLPRAFGAVEAAVDEAAVPVGLAAGEIILLVEDEAALLRLTSAMLQRLGYRVLAAPSPGEALRLAGENGGGIHLVISDVIMPEMNGRELLDQLRRIQPGLQCLFTSGYTADIIAKHGIGGDDVCFLQKPFTIATLGAAVRSALGQ